MCTATHLPVKFLVSVHYTTCCQALHLLVKPGFCWPKHKQLQSPFQDATNCLCCLQAQRDIVYIAQGDACFCDGNYIAAARLFGKVSWDLSVTLGL